jgi:hypothetical protein
MTSAISEATQTHRLIMPIGMENMYLLNIVSFPFPLDLPVAAEKLAVRTLVAHGAPVL